MSRITFENYGRTAREVDDLTIVSGRYAVQAEAQKLIVRDVATKLELAPVDRLLEIGCGPGNILIPLSFMVGRAVGIDHPEVCRRFRARFSDPSVELLGVNFLDYVAGDGVRYDKILIYSVLNTLSNEDEAYAFVDKAVDLLAPGGILLVGDIANRDLKARFLATRSGQAFEASWRTSQSTCDASAQSKAESLWQQDPAVYSPTDSFIVAAIARYRARGCYATVLPQPPGLPFGNTREDLKIHKAPV